jgi:hypothetical protein
MSIARFIRKRIPFLGKMQNVMLQEAVHWFTRFQRINYKIHFSIIYPKDISLFSNTDFRVFVTCALLEPILGTYFSIFNISAVLTNTDKILTQNYLQQWLFSFFLSFTLASRKVK